MDGSAVKGRRGPGSSPEYAFMSESVSPYEAAHNMKPVGRIALRLAAFRVAAVQAGHAPVHHDHGGGAALAAELRAFREVRLCEGIRLLGARLELRPLLVDQLLLVLIELRLAHEADGLQVLLDHMAELGDDGGHELA